MGQSDLLRSYADPVRPGVARAKSARRVPPCFVGTADQVRPRVTKATSAHRVPTWFVRTPTQCLPGWRASGLSECATGQHGPCMLVRHEVPSHTPSSGGHGSATRAHGTRILEPHGLAAHPSQQQRCRPCRTCNETSNLRARLPALTTLPAASLETVSENMRRLEGKCQCHGPKHRSWHQRNAFLSTHPIVTLGDRRTVMSSCV